MQNIHLQTTGTLTGQNLVAGINSGFDSLQQNIAGVLTKDVTGAVDVTLTANESYNGIIILTGTLSANINVIVPAAAMAWTVLNRASGAYTITFKPVGGTGVVVASSLFLICDGTNIIDPEASKGLQPGALMFWPTPTCPAWAVVRNGAALTRTSYANLYAVLCPTRSGTLNATTSVTGLSTTTDLYVGMPIEGTNIPAGTTIAQINSATAITMSAAATGSGTVPITLFYYGYGASGNSATFGVPDDRGLFNRGLDTGSRGYEKTSQNGNVTSGANTMTGLTTTKGLSVGMGVSGANIPGGTTIASITSATAITMSANATGSATVLATFTGGQIGLERGDTMASHSHSVNATYSPSALGAINTSGVAVDTTGAGNLYGGLSSTGNAETRPKFRDYLPIIVY